MIKHSGQRVVLTLALGSHAPPLSAAAASHAQPLPVGTGLPTDDDYISTSHRQSTAATTTTATTSTQSRETNESPPVATSTNRVFKAQYQQIEIDKGPKGFGFSIRGGKEFHDMPLFVLKIADDGPAAAMNAATSSEAAGIDSGSSPRMLVGDEIVEINGVNTRSLTHSEAIELIRRGGSTVRLLLKRHSQSLPQSSSAERASGRLERSLLAGLNSTTASSHVG